MDGVRVLVVDDDELNLFLLSSLLKKEGFLVTTAGSGKEAVSLAREQQPQIIFLDLLMPDMDGYETAASLAEVPETSDIPLIALTGMTTSEARVNKSSGRFSAILSKPINTGELQRAIRKILR